MAAKRKSSRTSFKSGQVSLIPWLAGVFAIVLAVFWPTLHSEFAYDSREEILLWDFIHDPGNLPSALTFRIMGMDVLDFNRPVAVTSFMFDSLMWGTNPFGYHLTSILLHGLAACLMFLLIRHFLSLGSPRQNPAWRNGIAFLATLLFALHPLVTEVVCEPANRKDLLASLFGLTALLLAIRHQPGFKSPDVLRMFLCPLLCLLAIGSKELGAAFPAILILYWFLFRRNEPRRFWAWTLSASVAVAVVFLIARFKLEHHPSVIFLVPPVYPGGSLPAALLVQPTILARYLCNVFWPAYLSADYNAYSVLGFPLWLSLLLLGITAALAGWWSMKDRRVLFGCGLIVFAILPVCNLVPIFHPMADRYLYLPLIGLAFLAAMVLDHNWLAIKFSRQALATGAIVLVICLLLPLTQQRETAWSTELALWRDTLERNPRSMPANLNLPEALLQAGLNEEAKAQSEVTLHTPYADSPWAWFDYALALERLGDLPGAQKAAQRAIRIKPDIMDVEKMVHTLQCEHPLAIEFARIAATLPQSKS